MSALDSPEALALLKEAEITSENVGALSGRLTGFLKRYLPRFYCRQQRRNASVVVGGLLSDLERKTLEPIAYRNGLHRKPVQFFVGSGKWDDEAVMGEIRSHVSETFADDEGVLVIDPSSFPKKGKASCGVKRQWCGRLGKVENCQQGVFLAYASERGHGPLDRRLYLPEEWANDPARRKKCHVPEGVQFAKNWQIAIGMISRASAIPHGWVAADDEFGRATEFRDWLAGHGERYVLDVPCNTLVRDLKAPRPRRRKAGVGRKRLGAFLRAEAWAARQPKDAWTRFDIRDGELSPLAVEAISARVLTKREGAIGPEELLIVIRSLEAQPRTWYVLSNASKDVPLIEPVRAHAQRHRVERLFGEAKGDVGFDHYEVRSWVGWHHHMTLSLLALWFLQLETIRLRGEKTGRHRLPVEADLLKAAS